MGVLEGVGVGVTEGGVGVGVILEQVRGDVCLLVPAFPTGQSVVISGDGQPEASTQ